MSFNNSIPLVDYGLVNALQKVFPAPIVAKRDPTTADKAQIGQIWVNITTNASWVITSIVNNLANWADIAGGGGSFTSLTVSGNITSTGGNILATVGNVTAAAALVAGTTVTAATGITATTGNIVASAGNITATGGSIAAGTTLVAGTDITAITGNIAAIAGSVSAGTTVTATLGNITASNGDLVLSTAAKGVLFGGGAKVVSGTGD